MVDNQSKHVVVVGAGYTGLVAAWRLAQNGHRVTVLDSAPMLGGMAGTVPYHGTRLEFFYHHWFTSDQAMLKLLDELGLSDRLLRFPSKMGFYCQERIWNFDTPSALLKFRPLSLYARLRFGSGMLWLRDWVRNWRPFEQQTAVDAMPRYVGREAFRVIWEPLLKGKFGPLYREVAMVWLWGKVKLRGASRSKGGTKEELLYPGGSFETINQALAGRIESLGGRVLINTPVERIQPRQIGDQLQVDYVQTSTEQIPADAVLHTAASQILADLTPELGTDWRARYCNLHYAAAVCLILGLKQSFSPIYWMNIGDPTFPFNALIEQTNLVPQDLYKGVVPLYVSRYLLPDNPLYSMDKQQLIEHYLPYLQRINPDFSTDWIVDSQVFRTRDAQPVIPCDYGQQVPPFETPVKGLFMANLSQIYPEDRGTNYSVALGNRVAPVLEEFLLQG